MNCGLLSILVACYVIPHTFLSVRLSPFTFTFFAKLGLTAPAQILVTSVHDWGRRVPGLIMMDVVSQLILPLLSCLQKHCVHKGSLPIQTVQIDVAIRDGCCLH